MNNSIEQPSSGSDSPAPPSSSVGQSRGAYQLAATILLFEAALVLLRVVLFGPISDLGVLIIDLPLIIGLLRVSKWARIGALALCAIEVILAVIMYANQSAAVGQVVEILVPYGAIVLLLTGQTRPWRLRLARVILGFYIALSLFGLVAILRSLMHSG